MPKIVLAHSGGFGTSVAIPWLAAKFRAEVVAVTVDLGQSRELEAVHERALALGAARAHVIDAREEFAREFVLPALQAGAVDDHLPLSLPLGRALIARHLVDLARIEGATSVAHGCAVNSGDAARLERSIQALDPSLKVIVLAKTLSPSAAEAYAKAHGIATPAGALCSVDVNLWGRTIECPASTASGEEIPEDLYVVTKSPAEAPETPALVEIAFDRGGPTSINGVQMPLVELIQSLETIAGAHGIGRMAGTGQPVRIAGEAPAAVALHAAHADLQRAVASALMDRLTASVSTTYIDLIREGLWFVPVRPAIDSLVAAIQQRVTGIVRLQLHKGQCHVVSRVSSDAQPESGAPALKADR